MVVGVYGASTRGFDAGDDVRELTRNLELVDQVEVASGRLREPRNREGVVRAVHGRSKLDGSRRFDGSQNAVAYRNCERCGGGHVRVSLPADLRSERCHQRDFLNEAEVRRVSRLEGQRAASQIQDELGRNLDAF